MDLMVQVIEKEKVKAKEMQTNKSMKSMKSIREKDKHKNEQST